MGVAWIHLLVPCAPPFDSVNACGAPDFRGAVDYSRVGGSEELC